MTTITTVAALRSALEPHRRAGRCIGLVPTMGALHEGHLSLVRRARETTDVVVVSIFVNPAQFAPGEDFSTYPHSEAQDAVLAQAAGADLLFVPSAAEVYPSGFATTVAVAGVTAPLEGEQRGRSHFYGVTTVVAKLFNMAQPDVAFFGQKDAQQTVVIRRMVSDLDIPVRLEVCPTVREPDGLARSSRNARLGPADRGRAVALRRGLDAAEAAVAAGERDAATVVGAARAAMRAIGVEPEYLDAVSPETIDPVSHIDRPALIAVAARLGPTRLIDNTIVNPVDSPSGVPFTAGGPSESRTDHQVATLRGVNRE